MAGYKRVKTIVEDESGETSIFVGPEGAKVPSKEAKLTVGEVEKLTGVKTSALRHYDKIGLLCPARASKNVANNRKFYGADGLERLRMVLTLAAFADWRRFFFASLEEAGYLEFRVLFENRRLIAKHIEATGTAGDASTIQMLIFFTWLARLMKSAGTSIAEAARLSDIDIVAALEDAQGLIDERACGAVGRTLTDATDLEDLADLAFCVSMWMIGVLANKELSKYLSLGDLAFELDESNKIARLLDVLGSEG